MHGRIRRRGGAVIASLALVGSFVAATPASAVDTPTAPLNLAVAAGPKVGQMTATWGPPTSGAGVKYSIEIAADHGPFAAPILTKNTNRKLAFDCSGTTSCDVRVAAFNAAGTGPYSPTQTGTWAVPGAPSVKTVTAGPGPNQMTVQWKPPKITGGRAISGYLYEVEINGTTTWNGPFVVADVPGHTSAFSCGSSSATGGCTYRMYAQNDIGTGPVSPAKSGSYVLPGAPSIATTVAGPATATASVSWSPPANTGGLPILYYTYDVSADGGAFQSSATHLSATPTHATLPCTATSFCSYRLETVTSKGSSVASAVKTAAYAAPKTPRSVTAVVAASNAGSGSSSVTVSWLPPSDTGGTPITDYQAQECAGYCPNPATDWDSAPVLSLGAGSTTWSPTCAAGQITCSYRIRAVNTFGISGWTVPAFIAPFAVTAVTATTIPADGDLTVSWSGPTEGGAGIANIELLVCTTSCSSAANWSDSGVNIPITAHSATDHCGGEVQCTYRLQITDSAGHESPISTSSTATAAALPTAPQDLVAVTSASTTLGAVDLTWQAPLDTGGFPVTGYTIERSTDNGATFPTSISVGNVLSYTDNGCGGDVLCTYHVASNTSVGQGPFSNLAQAAGSNVPGAPTGLSATTATAGVGAVFVQWVAPSGNGGHAISGYTLERSLDGGATWTTTFNLGTATSYTDSTCGARTACTYQVAAVNSIGTGAFSNSDTANGADVPTAPVLNASTSTATLGGVDLSWTPADGDANAVTDYQISVKVDGGSFGAFFSVGNVTNYTQVCDTNNNAAPDSTCTYVVRAINSVGSGPSSNQASAAALVDHVAPVVTIATPADNSFPSVNNPLISGTAGIAAGDAATVTVTIKLGASVVQTLTPSVSGGGTWSVNPAPLADGTYTVTAQQTDWGPNIGTSNTNTFTLDVNPPGITLTAPLSGSAFNDAAWNAACSPTGICGTATDGLGSGVAIVQVSIRQSTSGNYWDGSAFASASESFVTADCSPSCPTGSPSGTVSWSVPFSAANFPAEGSYTVHVISTDNAGNQTPSGLSSTFTIDRTDPTVSLSGPTASTIYDTGGQFDTAWPQTPCTNNHEICGTASDALSGVASVSVSVQATNTASSSINGKYWDGSGFNSATETYTLATGTTTWNLQFAATNFPDGGTYTVHVKANDVAGNTNTNDDAANQTRAFFVDYNPSDTVFVSPGGSDGGANPGSTSATPALTIARATQTAQALGRSRVVIAGGGYGAVSLNSATHGNGKTLRGGFAASTWKRNAPASNVATVSAAGTAFLVDGDTGIALQALTITATNAGLSAGSSVYGLRAIDSASVAVARSTITAAAGVAGSGGTGGSTGSSGTTGLAGTIAGTNGGNGGNGGAGCENPLVFGNCNNTGLGGTVGTSPAGNPGGVGGGGVNGQNGNAGANGTPASPGAGGVGGTRCTSSGCVSAAPNTAGGAGSGVGGATGSQGSTGTSGTTGATGTAGSGGSNAATNAGSLWVGINGTSGGTGSAGSNVGATSGGTGTSGTGGGGGGASGGQNCTLCQNDTGSGGGGGGGGATGGSGGAVGTVGQPGTGGTLGVAGGGSFAVYAFNASVTLDTNTTLQSAAGGTGGTGGSGGAGGAGGAGGTGANGGTGGTGGSGGAGAANHAAGASGGAGGAGGKGGTGGTGGAGGSGGGGGGGAGGPSVGAFHGGTGSVTNSGASISHGSGGSGGTAGAPNGATGSAGQAVNTLNV